MPETLAFAADHAGYDLKTALLPSAGQQGRLQIITRVIRGEGQRFRHRDAQAERMTHSTRCRGRESVRHNASVRPPRAVLRAAAGSVGAAGKVLRASSCCDGRKSRPYPCGDSPRKVAEPDIRRRKPA